MVRKPFGKGKRGAGRHVQLPEYLQATEAWATLKPGPRALYIELKRRFNGTNNGRIILSHREAATALNVHRNTIGSWFATLEERGFISMMQLPYLGPSGVGQAALWALQELPTADCKAAKFGFKHWRENKKPHTKIVQKRHNNCDSETPENKIMERGDTKIVTVG